MHLKTAYMYIWATTWQNQCCPHKETFCWFLSCHGPYGVAPTVLHVKTVRPIPYHLGHVVRRDRTKCNMCWHFYLDKHEKYNIHENLSIVRLKSMKKQIWPWWDSNQGPSVWKSNGLLIDLATQMDINCRFGYIWHKHWFTYSTYNF